MRWSYLMVLVILINDFESYPDEMNNLIASKEHQALIHELSEYIYDWIKENRKMQIPLKRTVRPKHITKTKISIN